MTRKLLSSLIASTDRALRDLQNTELCGGGEKSTTEQR